jgi:hypothetical protein
VQGLDGCGEVRTAHRGVAHGVLEVGGAPGQVAAVHGEAGQQFRQRIGGLLRAEARASGDEACQAQHFRAEDAVGDAALGAVDHLVERLDRNE